LQLTVIVVPSITFIALITTIFIFLFFILFNLFYHYYWQVAQHTQINPCPTINDVPSIAQRCTLEVIEQKEIIEPKQPILEEPTKIEYTMEEKAKINKSKTIFVYGFILLVLAMLMVIGIHRFKVHINTTRAKHLETKQAKETEINEYYPAVTSYINEMRSQGKPDEYIKENLLKVGWDKETVEKMVRK
jgi:hypothetical protein